MDLKIDTKLYVALLICAIVLQVYFFTVTDINRYK